MTISTDLIAAIATGATGIISAIGVILIAIMNRKVAQVETTVAHVAEQGNSVALELKRVNMVYAKRLAAAERTAANVQLANDAEEVYEEAKKSAERDNGKRTNQKHK